MHGNAQRATHAGRRSGDLFVLAARAPGIQISLTEEHQPDLGIRPVSLKDAIEHSGLTGQRPWYIAPIAGREVEGLVHQIRAREGGQQQKERNHFVKMVAMDQGTSWKTTLSWVGAILLALVFLVSGLWKLTDASGAAVRMAEARVPQSLSLAAALGFGIAETFTAVLLLVPRFRRWGAWLGGAMLVAFIIFIGLNFRALSGKDCSCFPSPGGVWGTVLESLGLAGVVGPAFFVRDGVMLALAIAAGVWARRAHGLRTAFAILGAVALFAAGSYGVAAMRQTGTKAPDAVTVQGKPYSLQQGKILIFYFDPECLHCLDAAKRMAKFNWGDTRIVAVPINVPQFAQGFLDDTHLNGVISNDLPQLKSIFPYVNAPAGVALVNGREKMALTQFEEPEPEPSLKKLGFIH